jgi:hypothetical protein
MADYNFTWVRATEDAVWHTRPSKPHPTQPGEYMPTRFFVRSLVEKVVWAVNREPVSMVRGLVVGFDTKEQADFFLTAHDRYFEEPRCEPVSVVPGMFVFFHDPKDALDFVAAGKAVMSSEEEFMGALAAAQSGEPTEHSDEAEVEIVHADAGGGAPAGPVANEEAAKPKAGGRKRSK